MKHIKLFEAFGGESPAQLLVSGDWMGITVDGTPLDFTHPSTYIFQYLPAGGPVPSGYEMQAEEPMSDMTYIGEYSFGGDQNGVNVAPHDYVIMKGDNSQYAQDVRQGILRLFIDPSINPSEIKSYLTKEAERIFDDPTIEEGTCLSVLEDPEEGYTPEFLSHCKAVVAGSKNLQRYISKYPEIFPGGHKSGLKVMEPRVSLIFKGM
jgi:hypothetical protein